MKDNLKRIKVKVNKDNLNGKLDNQNSIDKMNRVNDTSTMGEIRLNAQEIIGGIKIVDKRQQLNRINLKNRRDFFDYVENIIQQSKDGISRQKLIAIIQYNTGGAPALVYNALEVLEELELIVTENKEVSLGSFEIICRSRKNEVKP